MKFDVVVVGAGFFGCTVAHELAEIDLNVLVVEKREHIGGNAYSFFDPETGIEVPKYGSHIFHTNSRDIWNYVNQFSRFNNYVHRVRSVVDDKVVPIPINLETINSIFERSFTSEEARNFVNSQIIEIDSSNLEGWALSRVGRKLYESLIHGYTTKQWDVDPRYLPASTLARLPIRFNEDDRYFEDEFQGMPSEGYEKLFENMLSHRNIRIQLCTDFKDLQETFPSDQVVVYSGPIDNYFNYSQGALNWRTVDFQFKTLNQEQFQASAVMNFPSPSIPYTRIHEFKHFYPERVNKSSKTIIAYEYSRKANRSDEPYYPVNTPADKDLLSRYRTLSKQCEHTYFGGRLGSYQYLDMHMAINQGLKLSHQLKLTRWMK